MLDAVACGTSHSMAIILLKHQRWSDEINTILVDAKFTNDSLRFQIMFVSTSNLVNPLRYHYLVLTFLCFLHPPPHRRHLCFVLLLNRRKVSLQLLHLHLINPNKQQRI